MPRSIGGAGLLDHLIDRCLIRIPFVTVAPVLVCDLPLFFRILHPVVEPPFLLILIDMEPELQHHSPRMHQMGFHIVDLLIRPVPFLLRAEALDPLHHDPAVPGPVKNSHMAVLGETGPEPP